MIYIKSERELELMRYTGEITALILSEIAAAVKPGVVTFELDTLAEKRCYELKVVPAFKGYRGFPYNICISINEQVVHGMPSKRVLKEGDIVGLDFGVIHEGYYGDSATTVAVGKISNQAQRLIEVARKSLSLGIEQSCVGNKLFDISYAIQNYVESQGFSVVREFVGHGIGRNLHEDPQVPNYGLKGKGIDLKEGMVLAIEPMINVGSPNVRVEPDGWTAVTTDGLLSAHFEHTVAITKTGPEILTLPRCNRR